MTCVLTDLNSERWDALSVFCFGDPFAFSLNDSLFFLLLTVSFGSKPAHCLPVTMWMKWLQEQQDRPFGFLCIGGRLNALSIFLDFFPAPFDSRPTLHVFFLLLSIWEEDPAEGRLLTLNEEEARWVFKPAVVRRCDFTFYDRAFHACPFGGKDKARSPCLTDTTCNQSHIVSGSSNHHI